MNRKRIRPIAIYLPQFHPIPENDEWWGKGFTEWTNVASAKPRFREHYQPHVPADLGFYDLRLPNIMHEQAALAESYGISGFCFYHYWFDGKPILEKPVANMLASGSPDFPFMLAWANENWTRAWDGAEAQMLLTQSYSVEDHRKHADFLMDYFKDERYIRIDGKPVFAIYKDAEIPNLDAALQVYRSVAREHGIELYLCRFDRRKGSNDAAPDVLGFDAAIEFQPFSKSLSQYDRIRARSPVFQAKRVLSYVKRRLRRRQELADVFVDYGKFVDFDMRAPTPPYKLFPCVFPSWDNSSRRKHGATIFTGSSPEKFEDWVRFEAESFTPYSADENFLFVNAWNEWAEGNHLEPCKKYGHGYLRALRNGLGKTVG